MDPRSHSGVKMAVLGAAVPGGAVGPSHLTGQDQRRGCWWGRRCGQALRGGKGTYPAAWEGCSRSWGSCRRSGWPFSASCNRTHWVSAAVATPWPQGCLSGEGGRPGSHLQHVVQQGHAALLGLGLCELQQRADLEAVGVPRVAALRGSGWGVSAPEAWWEAAGVGHGHGGSGGGARLRS